MSHRHLIRFLDDTRSQWLALDRAGRVVAGPTAGLPPSPPEADSIVLVPSCDVLLLEAPRVARQRRQLDRALPFAIEDQLVGSVEQCHVAVLDDDQPDSVIAAVVAHERIETWRAALDAGGVQADVLLPESILLPWEEGPTLLLDGNTATLRLARGVALSGETAEVAQWLALSARSDPQPALRVVGRGDALPVLQGEVSRIAADPLIWLAGRLGGVPLGSFNVLTGPYQPARRGLGDVRGWAWAAAFVGFAVLLAMVSMAVERWQLDRDQVQTRAQMATLLREALPEVQRVVDPRAQLAAELARRSGQASSGGVLTVLARIAPQLSGSGRYTLDGIEYRGGTLDLTLRAGDVATLDELRERMAALGLVAELTSMTPGSNGVEGKLRLRGGGA